jgi:hypothetical protein
LFEVAFDSAITDHLSYVHCDCIACALGDVSAAQKFRDLTGSNSASFNVGSFIKFRLDLELGSLSVQVFDNATLATTTTGDEDSVVIFEGLKGPLVPIACTNADKVLL